MPRFFVEPKHIKGSKISIRGKEARHITNVLRLDRGDMITVFNGEGKEYAVLIEVIAETSVEGRIIHEKIQERKPFVEITLFQGLPKSVKMDFIVEKCTEIGVHRIVPMITSRTVPDVDEEKMAERAKRWERIAKEASKQSGRTKITEIGKPVLFRDALNGDFDFRIIPWEDERTRTLKETLKSLRIEFYPCRIGIYIGPEGGFTRDEIGQAKYNGVVSVSLGSTVLRTETAGLVSSAIVMYEFEPKLKGISFSSEN